jgi:hypothetical protein
MNASDGSATEVLWRRLDAVGLEWCRIEAGRIEAVVVLEEAGVPWRIEYGIELDAEGRTRRATIHARGGPVERTLTLEADGEGSWRLDGHPLIDSPDALDLDLGFSPVTNALPIRRLGVAIGEAREIEVAWVLFPSLEVVHGRQTYTRLAERRWRYASRSFSAELVVGEDDLVETYPGYWELAARWRSSPGG